MRILFKSVVSLLFLSFIAQVQAYSLGFSCVPNMDSIDATDCGIGEAQFSIDVIDYGSNQVLFNIINAGPAQSEIAGVYFDDGALLDAIALIVNMTGINFVQSSSGSPASLPGGEQLSPVFETTASFTTVAVNPQPHNGVSEFETLGIVFDLQTGLSFGDVLTDLETGVLRIGLHVIDFSDTGSESFVNASPVPVPATIWLFGSGLIGLIGFAKKCK